MARTRAHNKNKKNRASRRRFYGGGSGISVAQEQYGVYAPGNPAGAKADFEAMARDAADSMIAYPKDIFPKNLVGQEPINMRGGSVAMNGVEKDAGASETLGAAVNDAVQKLMSAQGGRRRRTAKKGAKAARKTAARKTVRGGKRKLSKSLKEWNEAVMRVYREMKAKNKDTKLRDAMKEAKRRKDKGQL